MDDYVKAAKLAGLSFIIFTDPLENLTPEDFARLKADCTAASQDGRFLACPGYEFTDGTGNRWVPGAIRLSIRLQSSMAKRSTITAASRKRQNGRPSPCWIIRRCARTASIRRICGGSGNTVRSCMIGMCCGRSRSASGASGSGICAGIHPTPTRASTTRRRGAGRPHLLYRLRFAGRRATRLCRIGRRRRLYQPGAVGSSIGLPSTRRWNITGVTHAARSGRA